jgi:hypothetical protein
MGKFDKFNKSNFKVKGLVALAIFFGFITIFIVTFVKLCLKKFRKEESNKNILDNGSKTNLDETSKKASKKDYTQDATTDYNSYMPRQVKSVSNGVSLEHSDPFAPKIPKNVQKEIKKFIKKQK